MPVSDTDQNEATAAAAAEDAKVRKQREKRKKKKRAMKKAPFIIAVLLALIAGLLGGYALDLYVISPIRPQEPIPAALAAEDLDMQVGSYTFDGKVYAITARDAIEDSVRLESRLLADGTYAAPTADMILAYARNRILIALADGAGATVTDDEVVQYAAQNFGSSDLAYIAQAYDMDEAQAWRLLEEAARVAKLREYVLGTIETVPAPALPADGNTEVANEEYGSYIVGLLGDLWDSATGTWADTDNDYYRALSNMAFSGNLGNYEAAMAAYAIASDGAVASSASASERWADYVNKYLDSGAITIATLRA